jgi:hypothetical protein
MVIVKQQRRGLLGCLHSLYGRATIAAGAVATIARVCSRLQRQGRSGGLSSGRGRHHFFAGQVPSMALSSIASRSSTGSRFRQEEF